MEPELISLLEVFASQEDPEVIVFSGIYCNYPNARLASGYRVIFRYRGTNFLSAHKNQIPPSVIMGQAIFESGWGRFVWLQQ